MDPLLIDIPSQLISERLILRTPRAGDGSIVCASVRQSLAELKQWMPWASDEYNEQDSEQWCRRAAAHFITREELQFAIFLGNEETHLGSIGAFKFDWAVPKCEIGYWLRSDYCGRGLMSEAVNALSEFLVNILQFNRLEIHCDERNARSSAVALRCGFALEGKLRNECRRGDNSLRNTLVYAKIA
ncbi:MAG TPA: GNAT family N-acetyltransferase [Tepidisphaeraceae bacterium]|nr:GNAT family N-acetyltransferase [Tepidisphaeraceae bacterium]